MVDDVTQSAAGSAALLLQPVLGGDPRQI